VRPTAAMLTHRPTVHNVCIESVFGGDVSTTKWS